MRMGREKGWERGVGKGWDGMDEVGDGNDMSTLFRNRRRVVPLLSPVWTDVLP